MSSFPIINGTRIGNAPASNYGHYSQALVIDFPKKGSLCKCHCLSGTAFHLTTPLVFSAPAK